MSTAPNQPEKLQSDAKPSDPFPDQPPSESPEVEEEEEDEDDKGECGFCVFMKGGGCKDTFIELQNCIQEAEDQEELDLFGKCSQVMARLNQCMKSHYDYYAPILRAEKHAEEQAVIELEKEKPDSAANNNQHEAPSQSS